MSRYWDLTARLGSNFQLLKLFPLKLVTRSNKEKPMKNTVTQAVKQDKVVLSPILQPVKMGTLREIVF